MALESVFDEEKLFCSETASYGNDLYHSPTYSDDSGYIQGFSLDDILLPEADVLQPMDMADSIINDVDFDNLREFNRSDSVSSSTHDHSYSICQTNFVSISDKVQEEERFSKLPTVETHQILNKENLKKELAQDNEIEKPVQIKKMKPQPELKFDNETFSYKDENGNVIVVDRSRKNAEMAKMNRQRKKRYISNLEEEVKSLRGRNKKLAHLKSKQESEIKTLQDEVVYLMSVIRNQTKLSTVLRAVSSAGISFKESNSIQSSHNVARHDELTEKSEYSGGVCLHVSEDKISLEFCSNCNKKQ